MKELKAIDYKLLYELMKNSHRSDRQLAKALGVSQPTITRRRSMLEKKYIDGYTIIPKFGKIGFDMASFTFLKSKLREKNGNGKTGNVNKLKSWYEKQPNVVLVQDGRGMGWDLLSISFHKNFSDYAAFMRKQEEDLSDLIIESETFHADLNNGESIKPFHLKYLSEFE